MRETSYHKKEIHSNIPMLGVYSKFCFEKTPIQSWVGVFF